MFQIGLGPGLTPTAFVPGTVTTLAALSLATPTATAGSAGSSAVTGKTSGSTLSLVDNVGGLYSIVGATLSWSSGVVAGVDMPKIRETLIGATNTPKDTTVAVTVSAAVSGGAFDLSTPEGVVLGDAAGIL